VTRKLKNKLIFASSNRYTVLSNEKVETENIESIVIGIDSDTETERKRKPPPILISGILYFSSFRSRIIELIGADGFLVE